MRAPVTIEIIFLGLYTRKKNVTASILGDHTTHSLVQSFVNYLSNKYKILNFMLDKRLPSWTGKIQSTDTLTLGWTKIVEAFLKNSIWNNER